VTSSADGHGLRIEITQGSELFPDRQGKTSADVGAPPRCVGPIEQHVRGSAQARILRGGFKGKDLIKSTVKQPEVGENVARRVGQITPTRCHSMSLSWSEIFFCNFGFQQLGQSALRFCSNRVSSSMTVLRPADTTCRRAIRIDQAD